MRSITVRCCLLLVTLVVSGCAVAQSVPKAVAPTKTPAPTILPTPSPEPTPTAVPSIALQDLLGWWTYSMGSECMFHMDAAGRLTMYCDEGDSRLNYLWDHDVPSFVDGAIEMHMHFFSGSCAPDELGRYAVAAVAPDELHWSAVEEQCRKRQTYYDKVIWTRAKVVEDLVGQWVSTTQPQRRLIFDDDLHYRAIDASAGEGQAIVSGAYRWEALSQQLMVEDHIGSPCRLGASHYTVTITDDTLTFDPVEDNCEERQQALGGWGPFTRSPEPMPLIGCYAAPSSPGTALCFTGEGLYRLHTPVAAWGDGWPIHPHEGRYTAEGDALRLLAMRGVVPGADVDCREKSGEYEFQLDGEALTLAVANDECPERQTFFTAHAEWARVKE